MSLEILLHLGGHDRSSNLPCCFHDMTRPERSKYWVLDLRDHDHSLTSRCCFHIISLIPRKTAPFRQSRLFFNSSLLFQCNHPNQSKWQMSDTDRDRLDRVLFRAMGAITWKESAWCDHSNSVLAWKPRIQKYLLFCLRTQLALKGRYLPWDPENTERIHRFFS